MSADHSVTFWVNERKRGSPQAAQPLWERYFARLVNLARNKLGETPRRVADEEDVALSAFDIFCRRAAADKFPSLHDRNDLWSLLIMITERKAIDLWKHGQRAKLEANNVAGGSAVAGTNDSSGQAAGLDALPAPEPTPELVEQLVVQLEQLLEKLDDAKLQEIALLKFQGYTVEEIAKKQGCVDRTVERKLERIRSIWRQELAEAG